MVPLLARRIPAKKERIWRVGQIASPDLVLSFDNASGAVLEEGPAVVYADDAYVGEAMVPYSARETKCASRTPKTSRFAANTRLERTLSPRASR